MMSQRELLYLLYFVRARSKSKVYVYFHTVQHCTVFAPSVQYRGKYCLLVNKNSTLSTELLVLNYHILSSPLSNSRRIAFSLYHHYDDERMMLFTIPFATITVTVIAAIKQFTKHHYTINTLFLMAWVHGTTYFCFQTAIQWLQEAPLQFLHIK